jgi:hypothetical protein
MNVTLFIIGLVIEVFIMVNNDDFEIRWLIKDEVALLVQKRDLTIPRIVEMLTQVNDLLDSSATPKLAVIVDGSAMKGTSNNVSDVVKEFRTVRSNKWGFTVVVGAQGIIKFFAQLILQLARVEVRLAKNMDEALEVLYRVNPSLPKVSGE